MSTHDPLDPPKAVDAEDLTALRALGLTDTVLTVFRSLPADTLPPGAQLGRITAEHRGGYLVNLGATECLALLAGHLRRAADEEGASRAAVGDWVAVTQRAESRRAADTAGGGQEPGLIVAQLERTNRLSRKAAGVKVREQVLAANVDQALIVDAPRPGDVRPGDVRSGDPLGGIELNLTRLGRYVTLVREGGVRPIVVITKLDLIREWGTDPALLKRTVEAALPEVEVHLISSRTGEGLEGLARYVAQPLTSVMLGPSGVGKSSLLNALHRATASAGPGAGPGPDSDPAKVQTIGAAGKGRHTTTHRELFRLPQGGLVIDTPGMRELGLWDEGGATSEGLAAAFPELDALAEGCRFRDCAHGREPGCAVRAAVERGDLPPERLAAYQKLRAESEHIEAQATVAARAQAKRTAAQRSRALEDFYRRRGR